MVPPARACVCVCVNMLSPFDKHSAFLLQNNAPFQPFLPTMAASHLRASSLEAAARAEFRSPSRSVEDWF